MMIRGPFNVYLAMVCGVEKHVQAVLEWDGENWQVLNVCLACCYSLEGEPMLCGSRMLCLDGNNSLKCIAPTAKHQQGNMHVLEESDYYLSQDYLNCFTNEVQSWCMEEGKDAAGNMYDGGDPANPAKSLLALCMHSWKAVSAEEKKKMWAIFDEMGIFVSTCPHGIILWIADMVKSGEPYVPFHWCPCSFCVTL